MMKLIILTVMTFFLSGCFYQTISNYDIELAINKCRKSENIVQISSYFFGTEIATCKNFPTEDLGVNCYEK